MHGYMYVCKLYCGCASGCNNTGELTGMPNALLWAERQNGEEPFTILYDSMYAHNITRGIWRPKTNKDIASLCNEAFKRENERRKGGVIFIHVKGHSDNKGNDKADERVQWGKETGPYCRFRTDGSTEGEYIDHPRPTTSPPTAVMSTPSPSFRLYQAQRDKVASKARRKLFALSATPISPISVTSSNFSLPNLNLDYSKHNHCNSHQAPTPKRFYCMDTSSTTPQSDINFSASNFHNNKG